MADVRAMLAAERAARAPPKKARQPPKAAAPTQIARSKKRKAPEDDDDDARKRTKSEAVSGVPAGFFDGAHIAEEEQAEGDVVHVNKSSRQPSATDNAAGDIPPAKQVPPQQPDIDEDEWAAFERDVAALPADAGAPSTALDAINSGAVITAAPMTAEEIAAQAREEQSLQRGRRDAEMEGEKEDAEQALAEEFEEMEALEKRVKRLRERRESLRKGTLVGANINEDTEATVQESAGGTLAEKGSTLPEVDEEEGDDDEADWDDWRFRGR